MCEYESEIELEIFREGGRPITIISGEGHIHRIGTPTKRLDK